MSSREKIYQQLVQANQNCRFDQYFKPDSVIDKFGRVVKIPCSRIIGEDVTAATFTEEYARNFVTNFILKNREFLGINPDEPKVDEVLRMDSEPLIQYIFDFKGQEYQGLKVRGTFIRVMLGYNTAHNFLFLHRMCDWYKEIKAPTIASILSKVLVRVRSSAQANARTRRLH